MSSRPQWTKIGRDISLEDYLNGTIDQHNLHGYEDWSAEIERQLETNGKINKAELGRYMNIERAETISRYLVIDPKVEL